MQRVFSAEAPDRLYVADITHVPTAGGFLYLAVILDVFSRAVVGWSMAAHLRTELVLGALEMALHNRRPTRVIHHSDQGCQYSARAFLHRCERAGVAVSMGSVGDCYDNSMAESFFATLECELIDRQPLGSRQHAQRVIFEFIEGWYNRYRRHSALGTRRWATTPLESSRPVTMKGTNGYLSTDSGQVHEAEDDVLAHMAYPAAVWSKISSTNPLKRVNKEIKRRSNVVGIFPNDEAVTRLVGAVLTEQSEEWATGRRYMSLDSLQRVSAAELDPEQALAQLDEQAA